MSTAALQYAPLPKGSRVRRARRIVYGVCLGSSLLLAVYFWPWIKVLAHQFYWERKCLNHQVAAGTIFYSNDPQDLPGLSSAAGYETTWQGWPAGQYGVLPNRTLEKLTNGRVLPALFVHGRNAPSGPQRLVLVQMGRMSNDPINRIFLSPVSLQPLGTRGTTTRSSIASLQMCLKSTDVVRLYCGQPDPSDISHFTIDYDLNGVRGTIDGNLAASGNITLTPQGGRFVLFGGTGCWSPGGAPFPPAVEEELARSPSTRPAK